MLSQEAKAQEGEKRGIVRWENRSVNELTNLVQFSPTTSAAAKASLSPPPPSPLFCASRVPACALRSGEKEQRGPNHHGFPIFSRWHRNFPLPVRSTRLFLSSPPFPTELLFTILTLLPPFGRYAPASGAAMTYRRRRRLKKKATNCNEGGETLDVPNRVRPHVFPTVGLFWRQFRTRFFSCTLQEPLFRWYGFHQSRRKTVNS